MVFQGPARSSLAGKTLLAVFLLKGKPNDGAILPIDGFHRPFGAWPSGNLNSQLCANAFRKRLSRRSTASRRSKVSNWKPEIVRRAGPMKLAPTREAEIVEEVAQHLEDRYRELLSARQNEDAAYRTSLDELQGEEFLVHGLRRVERDSYRAINLPPISSAST